MSAWGQKRRFDPLPATSGLLRITDIISRSAYSKVPVPEVISLTGQSSYPLNSENPRPFGTCTVYLVRHPKKTFATISANSRHHSITSLARAGTVRHY